MKQLLFVSLTSWEVNGGFHHHTVSLSCKELSRKMPLPLNKTLQHPEVLRFMQFHTQIALNIVHPSATPVSWKGF